MKSVTRKNLLSGFGMMLLVLLVVLASCAPQPTPTPAPAPTTPKTGPTTAPPIAPTTPPPAQATAKPSPTTPATPKPPIKIGVMLPLTGHLASGGEEGFKGMEMYFNENGWEVAGRKVELIREDEASDPKVALDKARKLVELDKVQALTGIISSAVAIAVTDYAEQRKVPLVLGMSGSTLLAFKKKSPYVVGVGHLNGDHTYAVTKYAFDKLGYRKAIMMASDYAAGHEFADVFKGVFEGLGGKVVTELYTPFGNRDFAPHLAGLKDKDADFIWAFYADAEAINFVNQFNEFGLNRKFRILGGQAGLTTPAAVKGMGDNAVGLYVGSHTPPFGALPGRAVSEKFAAEFLKKHGFPPGPMAYTSYQQVQTIAKAAEVAKGNVEDGMALLNAMKTLSFEGLCGPVKFDTGYNWMAVNNYAFEVVKTAGGELGFKLLETYEGVGPSTLAPYMK